MRSATWVGAALNEGHSTTGRWEAANHAKPRIEAAEFLESAIETRVCRIEISPARDTFPFASGKPQIARAPVIPSQFADVRPRPRAAANEHNPAADRISKSHPRWEALSAWNHEQQADAGRLSSKVSRYDGGPFFWEKKNDSLIPRLF